MIKIIFKSLMRSRGYTEIKPALIKFGFQSKRAAYLSKHDLQYINLAEMEKLCYHLNATPNDIFAFSSDKNFKLTEGHALQQLLRTDAPANINHYLDKLPANNLKVVENALKELLEKHLNAVKKK